MNCISFLWVENEVHVADKCNAHVLPPSQCDLGLAWIVSFVV